MGRGWAALEGIEGARPPLCPLCPGRLGPSEFMECSQLQQSCSRHFPTPTFTCLRTSSKGPQISFVPAFLRLVKSRCSTKSCPRPTERQFTLEKRGYKTPGASFPALPELIMEPKGSVTSLGRRSEVGMEDPTMDIRFGAFGGFGVWNCKERSKTAPVQHLGCRSTLDLQPLPLHNG